MVIATQNPSGHQGTYPLPESQRDRFMIRMRLGYPAEADEKAILLRVTSPKAVSPVITPEEVLAIQDEVERVKLDESLIDYLLAIVRATRRHPLLTVGVSTRGALFLQRAARALAFVEGRDYVLPDDIKKLSPLVLGHRVLLKGNQNGFAAREVDAIISEILGTLSVPL